MKWLCGIPTFMRVPFDSGVTARPRARFITSSVSTRSELAARLTSATSRSSANLAALEINADHEAPIRIRQSKYLNKRVEQDHRALKRRTQPMLGGSRIFAVTGSFWPALSLYT
jgi:transposase-like protein